MSSGVYRSMYDYLANIGWGTVGTGDDGNTYLAMDYTEHDCKFVVIACYDGITACRIEHHEIEASSYEGTLYPINHLTICGEIDGAYRLAKVYRYLLIDDNWIKMDVHIYTGSISNVTLYAMGAPMVEHASLGVSTEADSVIREVETHETFEQIMRRWDTLINEVRNT